LRRSFGWIALIATLCATDGVAQSTPARKPDAGLAVRLELADQYFALSHREELVRAIYEKQLEAAIAVCRNKPCQADLDRDIKIAAAESARRYMQGFRMLFSERLTERELRAAIAFANSPDGRAVTRAMDSMTGDIGQIGHTISADAYTSISRRFCPSHPTICVSSR